MGSTKHLKLFFRFFEKKNVYHITLLSYNRRTNTVKLDTFGFSFESKTVKIKSR